MNTGIRFYYGDRMVTSGSNVTKPTGFMAGAILHEVGTNKQFLLTGNNVWAELSPVKTRYRWIVGIDGINTSQEIGISGGFSYNTGSLYNELSVYFNGMLQYRHSSASNEDGDYLESSTTGVLFKYGLPSGACIDFIKYR